MKKKIIAFILILIIWVIFAGRLNWEVLLTGIIAALITLLLFGEIFLRTSSRKRNIFEYLHIVLNILLFIPVFFRETFKSALKVSSHIFKKKPSFSPGIVKVKTKLSNELAITILANLITLTPGTLTLDFDKNEGAYYIHWIDVKTQDEAEKRKEIIEQFEKRLDVIFK